MVRFIAFTRFDKVVMLVTVVLTDLQIKVIQKEVF